MTDATNVDTGGMSRRISEVGDLLASMTIIDPAARMDFAGKLAANNGWTRQHAEAVYGEYIRFLLMAWMSPSMVVPSHDVDQAWHLHLTHTRHYWDVLCASILMKPLHHEPSLGTGEDGERHADHYAATLSLYRYLFDEDAPRKIWPAPRPGPAQRREEAVMASGVSATGMAISIAVGMTCLMSGHVGLGVAGLIVAAVLLTKTVADAVAREENARRHARKEMGTSRQSNSRGSGRSTSTTSDTSGSEGALGFLAWTDPGPATAAHGSGSHGHGHAASDGGHTTGTHSCGGHSDGGHSCGSSCGGGGCGGGGD